MEAQSDTMVPSPYRIPNLMIPRLPLVKFLRRPELTKLMSIPRQKQTPKPLIRVLREREGQILLLGYTLFATPAPRPSKSDVFSFSFFFLSPNILSFIIIFEQKGVLGF